jgi:hypothetical protein
MSIEEQASQALIADANSGRNYNTTFSPAREVQTDNEEEGTPTAFRHLNVGASPPREIGLFGTVIGKVTRVGTGNSFVNATLLRT